jgi:hypothetical protein
VPVLLVDRSLVAIDPPGTEFRDATRTKNCFASSVELTARSLQVKARVDGYQSKLCPVGEAWTQYSQKKPYECRLIPKGKGRTRLADVPSGQRTAILQTLVDEATALGEAERIPALIELGGVYDVRIGLLAQRLLAVTSPKCKTATCIDELSTSVGKPIRDFLIAQKNDVAAEELRGAKTKLVRALTDKSLAKDALFVLDDPSPQAVLGTDVGSRRKLEEYVSARLPSDRAKKVLRFAELDFDPAQLRSDGSPQKLKPSPEKGGATPRGD